MPAMLSDFTPSMHHLPDPERQAEFYDGVTLKRGLAWVIDTIVIVALGLLVSLVTVVGLFFIPVFVMVVGFVYRVATISGRSATWGMRLMAIELRDSEGHRLDFGQALLHTAGYSLTIATLMLQIVSIGCMFATPRGQGLTDLVLGTAMLNRRA